MLAGTERQSAVLVAPAGTAVQLKGVAMTPMGGPDRERPGLWGGAKRRSSRKGAVVRRMLLVGVLLALLSSLQAPIDLPTELVAHTTESLKYVSPEGNLCEPKLGGLDGCIPSPMQCATGDYNGSWKSSIDDRTATCLGGGWHVKEYVGGDLNPACGAVIRDDVVIAGGWRDPNQVCRAYGVGSGYGLAGNRYQRAVEGRYGAVSSSAPEASKVGIGVLAGGGNAVDAAVAMVFAVGVVAPESCGLGGGGFLLYRGADGTTAALDFRETAPAALPIDFEAKTTRWGTGHAVVGVPGTVAGMAAARGRYGTKPLKHLLKPAIALAERGIRWSPKQTDLLAINKDRLSLYPASKEQFLAKDAAGNPQVPAPYPVSSPQVQGDLATTLRAIGNGGPKAFYRGSIADMIVEEMERSQAMPEGDRGVMTAEDLAKYQAVWRTPLRGTYRGKEVLAMPPPTAGGIVTLETLNLIEGWPQRTDATGRRSIDGFQHSSADQLHLLAEAKKLAWADRNGYVADPAYVAVPTDTLISKAYADERRKLINMDKANNPRPGSIAGFEPAPTPGGADGPNTHHLSVVDAAGNAVAVTCTIEQAFGSAVVVPGTGILLNNQLTDFDDPVTPVADNPAANKNAPEAGKRPRSAMSPTIVVADGRPRLVLGGFGGPSIPMGVIQAVSNVLDYGMEEGLALDVARSDPATVGGSLCCQLRLEHHRVPSAEREALAGRGHTFEEIGQYDTWFQPVVQMAGIRPNGTYFAAGDPRYDRGAMVRP